MTPATVLRLEAEQLPDAVVLVDDVVAGAQVGERLRARGRGARRRGARGVRKTCVSGSSDEPELAPDEAAPRRGDGEEQLRPPRAASPSSMPRLDLPQQPLGARRLAAVRERDDDAVARRGRTRRARSRPRRGRARRSPAAAPRTRTAGPCGSGSSSDAPLSDDRRRGPPPPRSRARRRAARRSRGRRASSAHEVVRHRPDLALVPVPVARPGRGGARPPGRSRPRRPGAARAA